MSLENKIRFQEYLSQIPIELAQTITLKNNLACNLYSKARLIELLNLKFKDKKFLTDLSTKLSEAENIGLMLVLFYKDEEGIPVEECYQILTELLLDTKYSPMEVMNSLVEYGLILISPNKRKTYCVSIDLRASLVEILAQKAILKLDLLPTEPATLRLDQVALLRDIFAFLAFLKKGPVKLTQENLIFKRTQLRIFDTFELMEQPLEENEKAIKGGYPERFDFICKFCADRQFIKIVGNHLTLTRAVEDWLAKSDFEKVKDVFRFWQDRYLSSPSEAYLMLKPLQLVSKNSWVLQDSLLRTLDLIIPKHLLFKSAPDMKSDTSLSILLYMGCIEQGILPGSKKDLVGIRLSSLGEALLLNDESLFPYKSEKTFWVQPNFEVIAPLNLDLSVRWYLTRISELLKVTDVLTYKLSRYSIYKTLQEGETAEGIRDFLWRHSEKSLPDKVHQTVLEWTNSYGQISFVNALMLRCENEALAKELKESKRINPFIVGEISPTYLIVKRKDYPRLLEILEEENYMPKPGVDRPSR